MGVLMESTVERGDLSTALSDLKRVLPRGRPSTPVLNAIHLTADGDELVLEASNLEAGLRRTVPAEVKESGESLVPGRKLCELANTLGDEPVKLQSASSGVKMRCGQARFELFGFEEEELPDYPDFDFEDGWTTEADRLLALIEHTAFAAARDDNRPLLQGVLWERQEDRLQLVATDGHRMARTSVPIGEMTDGLDGLLEEELIVPATQLGQVPKLFDEDEEVTLARTDNHLGLRSEQTLLRIRLLEGTYPDYSAVLPTGYDKRAVFEGDQLRGAIARMVVLATDDTRRIEWGLKKDAPLHLHARTTDLGEAWDRVACTFEGEAIDIAFNGSYLLDILDHLPDEEVEVRLRAPERAGVLAPAESADGLQRQYLVMPLRMFE